MYTELSNQRVRKTMLNPRLQKELRGVCKIVDSIRGGIVGLLFDHCHPNLVWVDSMILQSNIEVDVYYYYSPISMTTIIRADPINRGHPPQGLLSIPVDAKQQSKKRRQQSTTRPNYARAIRRYTVDKGSHPSNTTTDATSILCHNNRRRDVTTDSLSSTHIQL